ncbi:MAG: DUF2085 domain-containing protein [Myxococcota bacterium]
MIRAVGFGAAALALVPAVIVGAVALDPGLVGMAERWVGPVCHHDPARTLPGLAVCARCTGLWLGAAAAGVAGLALPLRPRAVRWVAGAAIVAFSVGLVAAIAEALGVVSTSNAVRVGLGALLGPVMPVVAAIGGRVLVSAGAAPPPRSSPPPGRPRRSPGTA